jgi:hypothetical protein
MPWLKSRLREIGRTPAGLARHLKLGGPRVYEMIAGRRGMQPNEIAPTAEYLDWPLDEVIKRLPEEARVLPADLGGVSEREARRKISELRAVLLQVETFLEMLSSDENDLYRKVSRALQSTPTPRSKRPAPTD